MVLRVEGGGVSDGLSSNIAQSPNEAGANDLGFYWVRR